VAEGAADLANAGGVEEAAERRARSAMKTQRGWNGILQLMVILLALSGCQAVVKEQSATSSLPAATTALSSIALAPDATAEPTSAPSTQSTATRASQMVGSEVTTPAGDEERQDRVRISVVYDNNPWSDTAEEYGKAGH
jgi:cobalamin synthase